ncbi:hypothetical protein ABB55_08200 [Prosthecomicrobium hirschii]|jgi:hypothetical protein|uniref:Type III secretion protein n=1 Tax=Prosthecodimorpha hirschii TaxID=665126 RepID=A0A0P6VZP8_9HYPH|nr:type III secretion system chaperone [Prosthecomicrobium hirschii]KPL52215.1 hypothetical protein ABB55_08200 [Prosthecomicrobium hirschii]
MNDRDPLERAADRLAFWIETFNRLFETDLTVDDPQLILNSKGGVEILITPVLQLGSFFFTASLREVPEPAEDFLVRVLAGNLFQAESGVGWFCITPETRQLCWQMRWDRFMTATEEAFLGFLEAFADAAEERRRTALSWSDGPPLPPGAPQEFTLVRA